MQGVFAVKLHLGCGPHVFPGWINYDVEPGAGGVARDLSRPLPHADGSVGYIFTEHFVEHVTHAQGIALFRECLRVLAVGGVLRVVTPSLEHVVDCYRRGEPIDLPGVWSPATPAIMLNEALRLWGHQFVYDRTELLRTLTIAGFRAITEAPHRVSAFAELNGLEVRPYTGELVMEATK